MIVFGAVLLLAGLYSFFIGTNEVLGIQPRPLGGSLLVIGGVLLIIGVTRRIRARRDSPETEPIGGPVRRIRAVPRLVRAAGRGYPGMRRRHLGLWALAGVYLISPIDLIPELLPIIGFTDDAALLFWLVGDISNNSGRFLNWERRASAEQRAVTDRTPSGTDGSTGRDEDPSN
ncbi:YkvA family protein [Actinoalloteichus hymeniacidonis]|uniref:DUF1232 family protein n=1 Tax=Actinoalloteichus hymeniacidonis TaxID=340345 RepID=A0AAC9HW54_9PSEU|nr:YkvA family protein [Actinoalloteichus hymeniacidonis]AOS66126.1 putative DUF1232 family protein [Actinoalloteichus hymeniacidonis]MBB5905770.1 uncharacterized membrane protein YkvA (DUF1232 family) [Actinoalloteichus hymeniacidonis]